MQIRTTSDPIAPAGHGHSIRDTRPDTNHPNGFDDPEDLFLIYITLTNNRLNVQHMAAYIADNVDKTEEELFRDAKKPGGIHKPVGHSFRGLHWRQPFFITLVLDLEGWDFYWGRKPGDDPLIFRQYKESGSRPYDENYSFYNAVKRKVGGRPAVRCINYLKGDERGTDLATENDVRDYSIDIIVLTPFLDTEAQPIKVIIDPDGQNQGPPSLTSA